MNVQDLLYPTLLVPDTFLCMKIKLMQLEQRVSELESLANEIAELAKKRGSDSSVQPELNLKGQRWYRGAREILVQQNSSGLKEFDDHYTVSIRGIITDGESSGGWDEMTYAYFAEEAFVSARSLLVAVMEEIKSRELPIRTQLSFAVSADEFDKASELLESSNGDEALIRAGGVVARVALERHLWTVVDSNGLTVAKNPPHKKHADTQDLLTMLVKAGVLTPIQKSEMDGLFTIGNNCAHPKETVNSVDVERSIRRGRELASVIL